MSFQFHYGSIRTEGVKAYIKGRDMFQFHYGSIRTATIIYTNKRDIEFQFHYGSIRTVEEFHKDLRKKAVSIPLWFN